MKRYPMTVEGEKALREQLQQLKAKRAEIAAAIGRARELGDLKENAEYHAAREQQSFNEGRIQELTSKLGSALVIDATTVQNTGKVVFGTTVTLLNTEDNTHMTYKIVGEDEADIKQGTISVTSPIARALIGKEEGEPAVVHTPNGQVEYEIEKVEHI